MKRWLSLMLTLCLLLSMIPTALAEPVTEPAPDEALIEDEAEVLSEDVEAPAEAAEFQLGGDEDEAEPPVELPEDLPVELPAPEAEYALPDEAEPVEKAPLSGTSVVLTPNTPLQLEVEVGQAFTVSPSDENVSMASATPNRKNVVQIDVNDGLVSVTPVAPGRVTQIGRAHV